MRGAGAPIATRGPPRGKAVSAPTPPAPCALCPWGCCRNAPMDGPADVDRDVYLEGKGPACQALRHHLKANRPKLPPVLRLSLLLSAACAAGLLASVGFGFVLDAHTGTSLIEYIGLQTVSGPQAATLFVFSAPEPP